ncbi:MAG: tRNA (adenosine(37)-N6)-threonylcarbamoyltransferase complex dimerization subunit type 1 TsaB [Pseudomonadota bacterium]
MILGIDTSAGQCAAALVSGDTVIARRAERMDRGHAERLFDLVEAALADAGLGLETIARIAVCTGPGSFTGLRVGVAGARGLALGRAVPALGITRFEALATAVARPGWPGIAPRARRRARAAPNRAGWRTRWAGRRAGPSPSRSPAAARSSCRASRRISPPSARRP